jgi:hypothetical protein
MSQRKSRLLAFAILPLLLVSLNACGESKTEKAEVVLCQKVARAVLQNPGSFKVAKSSLEETSEGALVVLEVDYSKDGASAHVSDKCWFGGYAEKKPLKSFSYRTSDSGDYEKMSDDDLKQILKQVSG